MAGIKKIKMKQFAVYTKDPHFREVAKWIIDRGYNGEVHLNRTRFWVPDGIEMMLFRLRWAWTCKEVYDDENYLTGERNGCN